MTREELRQWRHNNNVSPGNLAAGLSMNRNTVYRWENGDLEIPADIEQRLGEFLAKRDIEAAEEAKRPTFTDQDDASSAVDHGDIIGLSRDFWLQSEAARNAWIMDQANDPLRALPWPWWSHGFTHYPPNPEHYTKAKIEGRPIPHYLAQGAQRILTKQMATDDKGTKIERLRRAVVFFCRRDFPRWMFARKRIEISDDLHEMVEKAMKGTK